MELSKFLQQDIVEFLDAKSNQKKEKLNQMREEEIGLFSVERDYAKETEEALAEHNLAKAKGVFDELRKKYNEERDQEEKKKLFSILEEVYGKIKKQMHEEKSLSEELEDFGKEPEKDTKIDEMEAVCKEIETAIQNKNIANAVNNYRKLRKIFAEYPRNEKKIVWYKRVLKYYNDITTMHQETTKPQKEASLAQIKRAKEAIAKVVEKVNEKDMHLAQSLLIDASHAIARIEEHDEEKKSLEDMLSKLKHRVEFLKGDVYNKATELENQGKKEEAKELYENIITENPDHIEAKIRLEKLRDKSGNTR